MLLGRAHEAILLVIPRRSFRQPRICEAHVQWISWSDQNAARQIELPPATYSSRPPKGGERSPPRMASAVGDQPKNNPLGCPKRTLARQVASDNGHYRKLRHVALPLVGRNIKTRTFSPGVDSYRRNVIAGTLTSVLGGCIVHPLDFDAAKLNPRVSDSSERKRI
jgi:hypothetical protein